MLGCENKDYQVVAKEAAEYIESGDLLAARSLLISFIEKESPEGFIYLSIGEISKAIGTSEDILKAIEYFHLAIQFADEANDSQVALAAKTSLGTTYLQEAFKEYQGLPERAKEKEITGTLDFLGKNIEFNLRNLKVKENLFFAYTSSLGACNVEAQNTSQPLNGRWSGSGAGRRCVYADF
jgi:hypothetical protein